MSSASDRPDPPFLVRNDELEETLAIISDPALMAQIQESELSLSSNEPGATLTELREALGRRSDAAPYAP